MYNKIKLYFRLKLLAKKLRKKNAVADFSMPAGKLKKNILVVDYIIPEFDKDSGSRRITEIIKLMLKNGYGVYLLPDYKEYRYNGQYADHFRNLGAVVYEPAIDAEGKLITREGFVKKIANNISHAWLHRPDIFSKYHPVVKKYNPGVPTIFDMVDFHYLRLKREADLSNDSKIEANAKKQLALELDNCRKADKVVVISGKDKEALMEFYNDEAKMEVISNIHDFVPNTNRAKGFMGREGLLFVGGFGHKPNEDAVVYLCNEILPLVWTKHPELQLKIVGSNPSDAVKALQSDKVKVVGYVEDIVPYYTDARLFVAPLRYGAGIKGKIGQSLENSLPLVTTSIGAEGFDFANFEQHIVADTTQDFADKIIRLYYNEQLWEQVSNYSSKVIEPFSVEVTEKNILKILQG